MVSRGFVCCSAGSGAPLGSPRAAAWSPSCRHLCSMESRATRCLYERRQARRRRIFVVTSATATDSKLAKLLTGYASAAMNPNFYRHKYFGILLCPGICGGSTLASAAGVAAGLFRVLQTMHRKMLEPNTSCPTGNENSTAISMGVQCRLSPERTAKLCPSEKLNRTLDLSNSGSRRLQNFCVQRTNSSRFISSHLHLHSNLKPIPSEPEASCPHRTVTDFGRTGGIMCEAMDSVPEKIGLHN